MFLEYTFRGLESKIHEELDLYVDLSATLNTFTWFYNTTTKEHEQIRIRTPTPLEPC